MCNTPGPIPTTSTTLITIIRDCAVVVVVVVLSSDNFSLSQSIVRHFYMPWNFNRMKLRGGGDITSHYVVCFVASAWFFSLSIVYRKENDEEIWRLKTSIPYLIHVYIFFILSSLSTSPTEFFPSLFFVGSMPMVVYNYTERHNPEQHYKWINWIQLGFLRFLSWKQTSKRAEQRGKKN